jgi:superfamily II DNA or RNA helicase
LPKRHPLPAFRITPKYIVDLTAYADVSGVRVETDANKVEIVRRDQYESRLAELCATGSCYVRLGTHEVSRTPVSWDDRGTWRLELEVHQSPGGAQWLTGLLARDRETMAVSAPALIHEVGLLYMADTLVPFDHGGAYLIAATLRNFDRVPLAEGELADLLETLYALPRGPRITLPENISIGQRHAPPRPWLSVLTDPAGIAPPVLSLGFQYGEVRIAAGYPRETVFDKTRLALYHRDYDAERAARERLIAGGARDDIDFALDFGPPRLTVAKTKLASFIVDLVRDGWRVDAGGHRYRAPGAARAQVRSGIDWFDLDLVIDFDGATAALPALLEALRKKESTVILSDGTIGLVPAEWLARFGPVLASGSSIEDVTRFSRSQLGLLDALLAALPDVSVDETFERARERLHKFEGISPMDPPASFVGELRAYQREGLGWLHFLREFALGGCLADDMGLGKTVQVLALLAGCCPAKRPSIIVVPRSLVFNWVREAARFTPSLRVLDYSNPRRRIQDIDAKNIDIVITTYGILRSDAAQLRGIDFEYAILDEAQAIKNPSTGSAKAARLLRARHRLALSGTPIENRLEELWSLFEFLNPGMFGGISTFRLIADQDDPDAREILRQALRPVILRRTKAQVAPELPDRIEQTLFVELEPAQRGFYMQLLAESRRTVFDVVDRAGIGSARMHILTALLRLRQAACHPVLADPEASHLPSAKLDALIPSLTEIVAEGHKAVVFSQFTSFLALLRRRMHTAGIAYEYLDGATRDREQRVDNFQAPNGPPVFLISLKAGGHGLNLTAADYVYLLDPWWNPAVEAQAIDRAHRIGQTRHVIATRIVARDTIEEKVLELQASKRALADAILGADQGVLAGIGREELEMLLAPG